MENRTDNNEKTNLFDLVIGGLIILLGFWGIYSCTKHAAVAFGRESYLSSIALAACSTAFIFQLWRIFASGIREAIAEEKETE